MVAIALIIVLSPAFFVVFYAVYKTWLIFTKKKDLSQSETKPREQGIFRINSQKNKQPVPYPATSGAGLVGQDNEDEIVAVIAAAVNNYKIAK